MNRFLFILHRLSIFPGGFRIQRVLFLAIWRYLALWRPILFSPKMVFYIRKHVIKCDVTITVLTNYKVSEEYLRVRMLESIAGKVTCTPPFVNYAASLNR